MSKKKRKRKRKDFEYGVEEEGDDTPNKKRLREEFYLFIHAMRSDHSLNQKIRVFDPLEKKIIQKEIRFLNWFCIYTKSTNREILNYFNKKRRKEFYIESIEEIRNIKQTVGDKVDGVLKFTLLDFKKREVINIIHVITTRFKEEEIQFFESNIPQNTRFVTSLKLRFLEKISFSTTTTTTKKLRKIKNEIFEIPIWLITTKDRLCLSRVFKINEKYELTYDKNYEVLFSTNTIKGKIIVCWDEKENRFDYQTNFILFFKDFCLNFLKIKDTLIIDKMKIEAKDYYIINSKVGERSKQFLVRRFEIMCSLFFKYFQQALFLSKYVNIPILSIFKSQNTKDISDHIFLSNYNPRLLICTLPKNQPPYSSNAFIQKISNKNFFIANENEKIISLDYFSLYPMIMLNLKKSFDLLQPFKKTLREFLNLKINENDKTKKSVYKLGAVSIYGCFGIRNIWAQNLISSNTSIAKLTTFEARKLLEKTKKQFGKEFEVLYCNTDSIVIKGNLEKTKNFLKKWNDHNKPFILKIERIGEKLMIFNKQVRIWYLKNEVEKMKLKFIGSFFNSASVPVLIREFINEIILNCMKQSDNFEEFEKNFEDFSKEVLKRAKNYKLKNLWELVETRKFIKSKYKKEEGLSFTLPLYNSFNEDLLDYDFDNSKNFIDLNHKNFKIEKRLEKYIKKVKDLLNKCF